ncbi:hypothetical protein NKG05_22790 [Oerskovia sp. M15]
MTRSHLIDTEQGVAPIVPTMVPVAPVLRGAEAVVAADVRALLLDRVSASPRTTAQRSLPRRSAPARPLPARSRPPTRGSSSQLPRRAVVAAWDGDHRPPTGGTPRRALSASAGSAARSARRRRACPRGTHARP